MAKVDNTLPENLRLLHRRNSSRVDHINRIREANSKRQVIPWWNTVKEGSSPSEFEHKYHENCRFSCEDLQNQIYEAQNRDSIGNRSYSIPKQRITPLDAVKPGKKRRRSREKENAQKSVKNTARNVAGRSVKPINTNQRLSGAENRRISRSTKKVRLKQEENEVNSSPQNDELDPEKVQLKAGEKGTDPSLQDVRLHVDLNMNEMENFEDQNFPTLRGPLSSRDTLILKWLHGIQCPQSAEQNMVEKELNFPEKTPIRILKRPLRKNVTTFSDIKAPQVTVTKKRSISPRKIKRRSPNAKKGLHVEFPHVKKTNRKSPTLNKKHKSSSHQPKENPTEESNPEENKKTINTDSMGEESTENPAEESVKALDGVEMHVTELGKLQIILNLKSLTPDDAAIILWLDDLPKSALLPNFRKPLSITSFNNMKPSGESAKRLEDVASERPTITFPSVTLLKNVSVDARYGMRHLSDEHTNSVYYKRCNLSHADWANKA